MTALLEELDSQQSKPIWPSLLETPIPIDSALDNKPLDLKQEHVYWSN